MERPVCFWSHFFIFAITFTTVIPSQQTMQTARKKAEDLLKNLTLEEKIGQLFMAAAVVDEELNKEHMWKKPYRMDKEYIETLISDYYIGGIIYMYTSTQEKQIARTQHFQSISSIPLLIGQDLEPGGMITRRFPDLPSMPNAIELGADKDENLAYKTGKEIGQFCQELCVHINFAPVADINTNPNNPVIGKRSFGSDKKNVARKATAFMRGLHDAGILACAKHFPGHGDTSVDSHRDLPVITHNKERLQNIELYPFKYLIDNGIDAVMIAHLEIPALEPEPHLPATLSHAIVTDLLQHKLNFTGLIITDALDMQGVLKNFKPGEIELNALLAGNDILLCSVNIPHAIAVIKNAVLNGDIYIEELDQHVLKILAIKATLFDTTPQ